MHFIRKNFLIFKFGYDDNNHRDVESIDSHGLGLGVDGLFDRIKVADVHKGCRYTKAGKGDVELIVCAAVYVGRRDDVVAGLSKGSNGYQLGSLAAIKQRRKYRLRQRRVAKRTWQLQLRRYRLRERQYAAQTHRWLDS